MPPGEDYTCRHGEKSHLLKRPEAYTWTTTELGDVVVQQRLVSTKVVNNSNIEKARDLWDPSLRTPLMVAAAFLILLVALISLAPEKPSEEMVALKPDQNKYTRMIFDAKAVKKKRAQATKLTKTIVGQSKSIGSQAAKVPVAPTQKSAKSSEVRTESGHED